MFPLQLDCPKDAAPRQDWSAHLTTRTGFTFAVRRVEPDDEAALAQFFARVDPDDLRFRFLSSAVKLTPAQLASMTRVDHVLSEHFLALDPADGRIIASAMLGADSAQKTAEVAIAVDGDHRAQGIGWVMLKHAARFAKAHGISTLQSIENRDNHAAIDLEREMGFTAKPYPDDPTLMLVEADLTCATCF